MRRGEQQKKKKHSVKNLLSDREGLFRLKNVDTARFIICIDFTTVARPRIVNDLCQILALVHYNVMLSHPDRQEIEIKFNTGPMSRSCLVTLRFILAAQWLLIGSIDCLWAQLNRFQAYPRYSINVTVAVSLKLTQQQLSQAYYNDSFTLSESSRPDGLLKSGVSPALWMSFSFITPKKNTQDVTLIQSFIVHLTLNTMAHFPPTWFQCCFRASA